MDLLLIDKQGKLHIVDFKTGEKMEWLCWVNRFRFK
jgi:hypothetical protein